MSPPRLSGRTALGAIGCLVAALAVSGCGGSETTKAPADVAQGNVAERFATALLRGDADLARALLVANTDHAALGFLVDRAAAPWRTQHASIRPPVRHVGNRWTFTYAGTRTKKDGRFLTERGDLVVFVARSTGGAGVRFFGFKDVHRRYATHHDAQLLPSNR